MTDKISSPERDILSETAAEAATGAMKQPAATEVGGPKEQEPTRYGDWTVKGRCIDF